MKTCLPRMRLSLVAPIAFVVCAGLWGCSRNTKPTTPVSTTVPVGSISLAGGHRVDFFAPPDGPMAMAEVGRKGTRRVVDEETIARKRPSEIYSMLKGAGAEPPPALVEAEKRRAALGTIARSPPAPTERRAGRGPDDSAEDVGNQLGTGHHTNTLMPAEIGWIARIAFYLTSDSTVQLLMNF